MANEITVGFNLQVLNGYFTDRVALGQVQFDQNNAGRGGGVQQFTTSEEDFAIGDIDVASGSTAGFCYLRNIEAAGGADFLFGPQVGTGNFEAIGTLAPGEFAFFRLTPGVQLRGKASSGTCKVDIRIYED